MQPPKSGASCARHNISDRAYLFLRAIALDHVRKVQIFYPFASPRPHGARTCDVQFHRIQEAARIQAPCIVQRKHECTETCHLYGMHDLRRAYAAEICDGPPAPVVQKKTRHIETTLRCVETARQMKKSAEQVCAPVFLKSKAEEDRKAN